MQGMANINARKAGNWDFILQKSIKGKLSTYKLQNPNTQNVLHENQKERVCTILCEMLKNFVVPQE